MAPFNSIMGSSTVFMLATLFSCFAVVFLLWFAEQRNLLPWFYQNQKKLFVVVIAAIFLTPVALSLASEGTFVSRNVMTLFVLQLAVSTVFVGAVYGLWKRFTRMVAQDRPLAAVSVWDIREIFIDENCLTRPGVAVKVDEDEAKALLDCFVIQTLLEKVDNAGFANFAQVLLLARDGKEIPLADLLYTVETILASGTCTPESAETILPVLEANIHAIKPAFYTTLYKPLSKLSASAPPRITIVPVIVPRDPGLSPELIISQSGYEESNILEFLSEDRQGEHTGPAETPPDLVWSFTTNPMLTNPSFINDFDLSLLA